MTTLSSNLSVSFTLKELSSYDEIDSVRYSCQPKSDISDRAGASLVMSYIESFYYRISGYFRCSQENINRLYENAKSIDSSDKPSLMALMKACIDIGFLKNAGISFFNDVNSLWFFMREYKSVIVQLKLTSSTMNAHGFEIAEEGKLLDENTAKCFIVYRITPEYVILQNTLGVDCGVDGFNMVKLDLFKRLFINGACFTVEENA